MPEETYVGALIAYRIVRAGYLVFDGSGAARWGGRWTSPGRSVIHAAETYALAILENLVHFNASELPPNLVVSRIEIPKRVSRQVISRAEVPEFESSNTYDACREIGDRWFDAARTALLIVPSRLSPFECNFVIHSQHQDIAKLRVSAPQPARVDERLKLLLAKRPRARTRRG